MAVGKGHHSISVNSLDTKTMGPSTHPYFKQRENNANLETGSLGSTVGYVSMHLQVLWGYITIEMPQF